MDLQTLKNNYAQEQGYEDWKELREELYGNVPELRIEEYMDEICIRAQKAALENAAENVDSEDTFAYSSERNMYDYVEKSITDPENLIQ